MNQSCPINYKQIDGNVARLNAFFSIAILGLSIVNPWVLILLAVDFFFRAVWIQGSLLARISKIVLNVLNIEAKPRDRAPKQFAAWVGFYFTLVILSASLLNLPVFGLVVSLLLFTAMSLEGLFDYCLACQFYPYTRGLAQFIRRIWDSR